MEIEEYSDVAKRIVYATSPTLRKMDEEGRVERKFSTATVRVEVVPETKEMVTGTSLESTPLPFTYTSAATLEACLTDAVLVGLKVEETILQDMKGANRDEFKIVIAEEPRVHPWGDKFRVRCIIKAIKVGSHR